MQEIKHQPTFIDLCAGIGGFRQAFDKAGAQCLLTCEIDKFCHATYHANYQGGAWENDIKKIVPQNLADFNILCAGFPCQAFSLAGKRQGFADMRGTIIFDIAQILKEKNPGFFLMENVKNLFTHDQGRTFATITNALDEVGYFHKTFIVDAQYFVPQKRQRIYMLGASKQLVSEEMFQCLVADIEQAYEAVKNKPLPHVKDILEQQVASKYTLSDKLWSFLHEHAQKHNKKGNGFGYCLIDPDVNIATRTLTARYYKDGSEILIKQANRNPRKLTPRECARLMGFPEDFKIVCSDTQAYKQFGNSVVVSVIEMFAQHIVRYHHMLGQRP